MKQMRYFFLGFVLIFSSFAWGQFAVNDKEAIALDTQEEKYTEKSILYIEEAEKDNEKIVDLIGGTSNLDTVSIEWKQGIESHLKQVDEGEDSVDFGVGEPLIQLHGSKVSTVFKVYSFIQLPKNSMNLLGLKYLAPWGLATLDKNGELSSAFKNDDRGEGEAPTNPEKIVEKSGFTGSKGNVGNLLLKNDTPETLTKTQISQSEQMVFTTTRDSAVALIALQSPIVVSDFQDMSNIQESYDGESQLVIAQLALLNELTGLAAIGGEVTAIQDLYNVDKLTQADFAHPDTASVEPPGGFAYPGEGQSPDKPD